MNLPPAPDLTGRLLGSAGLVRIAPPHNRGEVGYWLDDEPRDFVMHSLLASDLLE